MIHYTVRVHLWPGNFSRREFQVVVDHAFDRRESVTGSADDAGLLAMLGKKPNSRVVVWEPERVGSGITQAWFDEHYPGAIMEVMRLPGPAFPIADIIDQLPKHPTKVYGNRPTSDITTIVIHHSVSPPDRPTASIAAYHINSNGWPGIGYHFVVKVDGTIEQTNRLVTMSYHTGGQNYYSIGVCLQGDFTLQPPPTAQLDAARELIKYLQVVLGRVLVVSPHRSMPGQQTACPGATWEEWFPSLVGELPTPTALDLAAYFRPAAGTKGKIHIMQNSWSGDSERVQTQLEGDRSYIVKNQQYEERRIGEEYLDLLLDTSPGNNEYYTVTGHWLRRHMEVGEEFTRTEMVTFRRKGDCQPVPHKPTYTSTSTIHFVAHHPTWTSKAGITVDNVVELAFIKDGEEKERYWYAVGRSLVGWQELGGRHSWMSELVEGQEDNQRETGCFS